MAVQMPSTCISSMKERCDCVSQETWNRRPIVGAWLDTRGLVVWWSGFCSTNEQPNHEHRANLENQQHIPYSVRSRTMSIQAAYAGSTILHFPCNSSIKSLWPSLVGPANRWLLPLPTSTSRHANHPSSTTLSALPPARRKRRCPNRTRLIHDGSYTESLRNSKHGGRSIRKALFPAQAQAQRRQRDPDGTFLLLPDAGHAPRPVILFLFLFLFFSPRIRTEC